jgi:YkoY family integral membrane protein
MLTAIILICNLFVLESLLSVDNAAVLALMVKDLPLPDRPKALKYGLLGAFVFRGTLLLVAAWLVKIFWLKIAGGGYLIYLVVTHFTPKRDSLEEGVDKQHNPIFKFLVRLMGLFWATVVLVEIMDLAFSVDNIFAAVAFTDKIVLILIGVFMGMVAMRFVAVWFMRLMERFKTLETSAFIVIGLLGLKLIVSGFLDWHPEWAPSTHDIMTKNHMFDFSFSAVMMCIFFMPMLFSKTTPHALSKV